MDGHGMCERGSGRCRRSSSVSDSVGGHRRHVIFHDSARALRGRFGAVHWHFPGPRAAGCFGGGKERDEGGKDEESAKESLREGNSEEEEEERRRDEMRGEESRREERRRGEEEQCARGEEE
eukprot:2251983-Rhodomonas_salina.1